MKTASRHWKMGHLGLRPDAGGIFKKKRVYSQGIIVVG